MEWPICCISCRAAISTVHPLAQIRIYGSPDNASDDASHFYFFLSSAKVGCHPAPFWLGAAAMTLIFFFLGFLASRLLLCWPLAMSISLGLRMTQIECRIGQIRSQKSSSGSDRRACQILSGPEPRDQIKRAGSIWPSWVQPMWILPGTRGLPRLSVNFHLGR